MKIYHIEIDEDGLLVRRHCPEKDPTVLCMIGHEGCLDDCQYFSGIEPEEGMVRLGCSFDGEYAYIEEVYLHEYLDDRIESLRRILSDPIW
jgi:hypothetical protein